MKKPVQIIRTCYLEPTMNPLSYKQRKHIVNNFLKDLKAYLKDNNKIWNEEVKQKVYIISWAGKDRLTSIYVPPSKTFIRISNSCNGKVSNNVKIEVESLYLSSILKFI